VPFASGAEAPLVQPRVQPVVARDMAAGLDLHDFQLLHWAALKDKPRLVQQLLDQGQDVDDRDASGRTPLMVAAAFDSRQAAAILLANGADPSARDEANGDTALHFAALAGHTQVAAMLLSHKADIGARSEHNGETPLHYAALYGHREAIAFLAANGAAVDIADLRGIRPLQYARMRNRQQAIELLVSLGARPDDLFDAVNAGDVARVQALVAAGSSVNETGLAGTPLHLAVATGQLGIAVMLIDAGAELEAEGDPAAARPLHLAATSGQAAAIRLLLDRGAMVDARDAEGRTGLALAASYGHTEAVATLLEFRADPHLQALDSCSSPLQSAAVSGSLPVAKLLISYGASVNEVGNSGATPLHCAVRKSPSRAMVALLMARGADALREDERGMNAMEYARLCNDPQLFALLEPQHR
jgi:cytohesin